MAPPQAVAKALHHRVGAVPQAEAELVLQVEAEATSQDAVEAVVQAAAELMLTLQ